MKLQLTRCYGCEANSWENPSPKLCLLVCPRKHPSPATALDTKSDGMQTRSYYDFIKIHDRLKSMSDGNDGAICASAATKITHNELWNPNNFSTHCFRMVFWIASSVSISMAAVASSRSKILLWRIKARAKHKSCLWPTLKLDPPSDTTASSSLPGELAPSCLQHNEHKLCAS